VPFNKDAIFGFEVPASIPDLPAEVLNPRNSWSDKIRYDETLRKLAFDFVENFKKYADNVSKDILLGAPSL